MGRRQLIRTITFGLLKMVLGSIVNTRCKYGQSLVNIMNQCSMDSLMGFDILCTTSLDKNLFANQREVPRSRRDDQDNQKGNRRSLFDDRPNQPDDVRQSGPTAKERKTVAMAGGVYDPKLAIGKDFDASRRAYMCPNHLENVHETGTRVRDDASAAMDGGV